MVKSVDLFNYYAILLLINVLLDPFFAGGHNHLVLEHAHQHNEPWRTKCDIGPQLSNSHM